MRVLYVTAGFPLPLTSGYLRHFHLASGLAQRGHEVLLASLSASPTSANEVAEMAGHVSRVGAAARPADGVAGRLAKVDRASELLIGRPAGDVRRLREIVVRFAGEGVDVAVVSGKRTAAVLPLLSGTPLIVDLCDATSERLAGMVARSRGWRRWRHQLQLRRVRRAEEILIARGDRLLVASERDRRALGPAHEAAGAVVLPNGVDGGYWHRRSARLGRDSVVFTGVMDYEPNEDAALALIRDVMPRVWGRLPDATLAVVGRNPTDAIRSAARDTPTQVTGYVDDVRPYLERAAVFAAPLRFGAGIQNKLLEAMAMEVPAVVSPLAAAGLTIDGHAPPVMIADDPDTMAAAIVDRLESGDPTPDRRGREFVVSHFSWERGADQLDALVRELGANR